jgi:hypothetical protein
MGHRNRIALDNNPSTGAGLLVILTVDTATGEAGVSTVSKDRKARRKFISTHSELASQIAAGIREFTGAQEELSGVCYKSPALSGYQRVRLKLLYQERDLWMRETGWFGSVPTATN